MNKSGHRHAALYIRVSTEAQRDEGYSIEAQHDMLEGYCKSRRIEEYEFYTDGGFSGSNIERPEMVRLISDVKANKISSVIVYKLDRLSRSQKDTLYLIEDVFNPHGTDFVSLNENMDTSTPIGRAMLGIMSAFAQLERETIRERTRMGMKERIRKGYWRGGGHVPFGYDYDAKSGKLIPNEDAVTVRRMYELYLSGYSMLRVAQAVGLRYERLAQQIILRKTNAGYIVYNGEFYPGQHEPIISEEIYEKAVETFKNRSNGRLTTSNHLLSGLLICGICGAKMRYQKWGKAGCKIYCYSQDKGKPHLCHDPLCDNERIDSDELEDTVISDLFNLTKNLRAGDNKRNAEDMLSGLETRRLELKRKLKKLYGLYSESSDDILVESIDELKKELEKAEKLIESERRSGETLKNRMEAFKKLDSVSDAWEYMTITEKQNLVREYIEKIVITHGEADIYYRW